MEKRYLDAEKKRDTYRQAADYYYDVAEDYTPPDVWKKMEHLLGEI